MTPEEAQLARTLISLSELLHGMTDLLGRIELAQRNLKNDMEQVGEEVTRLANCLKGVDALKS